MANLLDDYRKYQEKIKTQIAEGNFPAESTLIMQELNYRIYVLETLQTFCKSAPVTDNLEMVSIHYQIMAVYLRALPEEHKIGAKADEDLKNKRKTARDNLEAIIQDNCRRFNSFKLDVPDQYKRCVSNMINTVLAAWFQYRNTYINI